MAAGEKWGAKDANALTLPCDERPGNGNPIIVGPSGEVTTRQGLTGQGIASGAVDSRHLGDAIRNIVFAGGGFDGEADFDGSATVLGIAISGSTYTLTRDISCTRLQVRSTYIIRASGFKIFARELHLWGTAIIHADGPDGGDSTTAVSGKSVSPPLLVANAIILGGAGEGGDGGDGGQTAAENGDPGSDGDDVLIGLGGDGDTGSDGETIGGGGTGGSAGSVGLVTGYEAHGASLDNLTRLMRGVSLIHGGAGGAGGGGGGATGAGADGGGGGAGGSGGGVLMIAVDHLVLHSWTGRISANGGMGGDGAAGAGAAGDGGRGGGGGGGVVHLLYVELVGGLLVPMTAARNTTPTQAQQDATGANVTAWGGRKGTTGSGVPPTSSATIAGCGTVRVIGPEVYVPPAERPPIRQPRPPFAPAPRLHAGHLTRR